ncbi:MAG: NAD(P)/FAD-dependent oxidoreductase [Candidatus Aenigmatarchaeota archaeon]
MIVIIGAGISGLTLSYFLSQNGIKNIVIDLKRDVGLNHRSTSLISDKIFRYLDFFDEEDSVNSYNIANFWYGDEKVFSIESKKKMYIFDYRFLERKIFENIDKRFSNFLFSEKVLDVDFERNILITNKRKINFEILVDASGTYAFLANKLSLFKFRKVFTSFEVYGSFEKKFEDINIFFDEKFSKKKFGWFIEINDNALVGLIDKNLKNEKFNEFLKNFGLKKIIYQYSHPILFASLKKLIYKNSIIVGEAAGIIKPFSFGGITYGILSSYVASKCILSNSLADYEKKIRKIFKKSLYFGMFVDKLLRKRIFAEIIRFFGINKLVENLDPDFLFF